MNEYITGQLTTVGIDQETGLTRALIVCDKDELAAVAHLPIYHGVTVVETEELTRLQSRLEECENERDELAKKRKDDSFECSVMSAITGRENGETLTMAVDRTCRELDKANQDLTALRALVAKIQACMLEICKITWTHDENLHSLSRQEAIVRILQASTMHAWGTSEMQTMRLEKAEGELSQESGETDADTPSAEDIRREPPRSGTPAGAEILSETPATAQERPIQGACTENPSKRGGGGKDRKADTLRDVRLGGSASRAPRGLQPAPKSEMAVLDLSWEAVEKMILSTPPSSLCGMAVVPVGHPEAVCHDCGGANVVWFAPNNLWNQVVRKSNKADPILCPRCFILRATAAGICDAWTVLPETELTELRRDKERVDWLAAWIARGGLAFGITEDGATKITWREKAEIGTDLRAAIDNAR